MIATFIARCEQSGISFAIGDNGKLKINADKSALTTEIVTKIKQSKDLILSHLHQLALAQVDEQFQQSVPGRAKILERLGLSETDIVGFYPLVPLQEGMLLHHMVDEANDPYIVNFVLKAKSHAALLQVLDGFRFIVERHASFRTAIVWRGVERGYQLVKHHGDFPVEYIDCEDEADHEQKLAQLKAEPKLMDLEKDPLMRIAVLVKKYCDEYVLFIERHHIICDHISLEIIMFELLRFFNDEQAQLPKALQHYRFALALEHQSNDSQTYFSQLLAGFETPTLLHNINQLHVDPKQIEAFAHTFASDTSNRLRAQIKQVGVSPAVAFHLAWAMVCSRFCDQSDVLFTSVFSGRMKAPEYRNTVGMFLNALPFRLQFGDKSVKTLLQQVNMQLMQAYQHEQVPLSQSLASVSSHLDTVYNCVFNFRHSAEQAAVEALPFELLDSKEVSTTPFSLSINDLGDDFSADLDVLQGIDATGLLIALELALESIVDALEQQVQAPFSLPLLLPAEEVALRLSYGADKQVEYAKDSCIFELFEQWAEQTPDKTAVIFAQQHYSYAALNRKANQLARYIRQHHDIEPDSLIGICVPRSVEMVIAILAILKAGGAYVPLDPNYPQERLNYMMADAKLQLVLAHSQTEAVFADFAGQVLRLDGLADGVGEPNDIAQTSSQFSPDNLAKTETGVSARHLAYVIYTSGSTGLPKGVMVEHQSLVNYQEHIKAQYGLKPQDNMLQFSNIAFDIFVEEVFGALCQGASLTLRDEASVISLAALLAFCQQHQVSMVSLPTAYWSQLLSSQHEALSSSLKMVIVGGEALSVETVQKHYQLLGDSTLLVNSYGPTEATVTASTYVTSAKDAERKSIPIGQANINNQLLVLDSQQALCPVNCVGELYIGGDGLARGYLGQDELTAQRFIANPYEADNGAKRLYRTGDLVRLLADGNLEFIDRIDEQVKVRGFRVEPGEVESALSALEGIDSALVMAKALAGMQQLVGYVKTRTLLAGDEIAPFIQQTKAQLGMQLPDYMVPSALVVVEQWPLTANGKVDRKALPEPDLAAVVGEYVAPVSATEKLVVTLSAQLLGLSPDKLSVTANFIEAGGNSILCLRLSQGLSQAFAIEPPLAVVLEAADLKELALELDLLCGNAEDALEEQDDLLEEQW